MNSQENWHITKKGDVGVCSAEEGNCPLGGEHFPTEATAREAFETDMKDLETNSPQLHKAVFEDNKNNFDHEMLAYRRREFFNEDNLKNYTLIDVESGTVFSTEVQIVEEPKGLGFTGLPFYDAPTHYSFGEEERAQFLATAKDISMYERPVMIEYETGLVVEINPENIYAIDHSNDIIDFDEILEDSSAAEDTAKSIGFKVWETPKRFKKNAKVTMRVAEPAEKFENKYELIEGDTYNAKGEIVAIQNPTGEPITIIAPWGEEQHGGPDCWIAKNPDDPSDRYIIGGAEFAETYISKDE